MGENQYVIYFKMIVSGEPTKYDDVGCDGLYIESIEKTDEVAQLENGYKDILRMASNQGKSPDHEAALIILLNIGDVCRDALKESE